jgi:hypothetical protein
MTATKDVRLYAKFTLDFPSNPKVKPLTDAAFRALVEATIYSREHQTDGFLAKRLALANWSLETLRELCANDDVKPSLSESEDGWFLHDYAEHQDTKAEIQARRERAIAAGQKGGLARAKRTAKRPAKQKVSDLPSKIQAEREREIENITTTYVSPSGDPPVVVARDARNGASLNGGASPPPPCKRHPDGWGHTEDCQDCAALRLWEKNSEKRAADAQRNRDETIRKCRLCDDRGYVGLSAGPFIRCPHDPGLVDELQAKATATEARRLANAVAATEGNPVT